MKYIVVWDYNHNVKMMGIRVYNPEIGWTVARPDTELAKSSQCVFDKIDLQNLYYYLSIQVDGKKGVLIAKKNTIPLNKVSQSLKELLKID